MGHSGVGKKNKEDKEVVERKARITSESAFVNIGIAIAFSFAGFVLSQIATRTRHHSTPPSLVIEEEEEEESSRNRREDECNLNETTHARTQIGATATHMATSTSISLSPTRSSSGDEAGFLLPEFNDLVLEEFESSTPDSYSNPNLNPRQIPSTREIGNEVAILRNMVCSLQEREKSLKLQQLEFSNLKEHKKSISQLKNQIKVKDVEIKLYTIKVESLLSDNHRLQTQLSEISRTMAELDAAKAQIRILTDKVQLMKDKMEQMHNREENSKGIGKLEEELKGLRLVNAHLEEEKLELLCQLRLQKADLRLDTTFHTSKEVKAIEEAEILRREVEKLKTEIEQLKNSRCADLEELVYLKWINACLRYELREYNPVHGKILARDLSISLSPSSKESAKQLIQDYAFNSGATSWDDSNWDYSSESSEDFSKLSNSKKTKLFGKLKSFVLGKDEKNSDRVVDSYRFSFGGSDSSCMTEELALPVHSQRSLNREEKLGRSQSDAGLGYREKGVVPLQWASTGNDFIGNGHGASEVPEKTRLKRLAAALEEPRGNINRRAASFSFTTSNSFTID